MKVTDETLLNSGFTPSDLQKMKNNVESYGGTLGNAIKDLATRFVLTVWVVSGCLAVFIFLMIFASEESFFLVVLAFLVVSRLQLLSNHLCLPINRGDSVGGVKNNQYHSQSSEEQTIMIVHHSKRASMVLAAKFRLDCDKVHQYTHPSKRTLHEQRREG